MIHNRSKTHRYIGATANLKRRMAQHWTDMRTGTWTSRLAETVSISTDMRFTVLLLCDVAELPQREAEQVAKYRADMNASKNYSRQQHWRTK